MLGKLLKHEFRATARFMWVIYAAMLVPFDIWIGRRLSQSFGFWRQP